MNREQACAQTRIRPVDFVLPLLCLLVYTVWSSVLPITSAPDEAMRLPIPTFILNHGYLPNGDEAEIVHGIWGTSYAFVPYGSSLLATLFARVIMFFTQSQEAIVWAIRQSSVLPAAGTVLLCELIGKRVFAHPLSPYMLALLCGFLPQAVFCASYLNNECLMVFCTAAVIHAWLLGTQTSWTAKNEVYLGVGLGVLALTYYFGYWYMIVSIPIYIASKASQSRDSSNGKLAVFRGICTVLLVAFAVGGWFFVRNAIIHNGDVFGMKTSSALSEQNALPEFKPSVRTTPRKEGVGLLELLVGIYRDNNWFIDCIRSAIGYFGFIEIPLTEHTYVAYMAFFGISLLCCVPYVIKSTSQKRCYLAICVLLCALSVAMSLYFSWSSDYEPQGRYFASGLIPFMMLITCGLEWMNQAITKLTTNKPAIPSTAKHANQQKSAPASFLAASWPLALVAMGYLLLFVYVALSRIIPYCCGGILA